MLSQDIGAFEAPSPSLPGSSQQSPSCTVTLRDCPTCHQSSLSSDRQAASIDPTCHLCGSLRFGRGASDAAGSPGSSVAGTRGAARGIWLHRFTAPAGEAAAVAAVPGDAALRPRLAVRCGPPGGGGGDADWTDANAAALTQVATCARLR